MHRSKNIWRAISRCRRKGALATSQMFSDHADTSPDDPLAILHRFRLARGACGDFMVMGEK
jgi:hypothetical protein